MIKSVYHNQGLLLRDAIKLHVPDNRIDCDPTYGRGMFYKDTGVQIPKYRFDLAPQVPDVAKADARELPLLEGSIRSIIFDPPHLATKGPSIDTGSNSNLMVKRFGFYPSEEELHQLYQDALVEFYRVLKNNGVVLFKCMDKVSSGKQYMSHCFIYNTAVATGFYPKDLFILVARSRLIANWQRNQQHARKFHSYFWVLEKRAQKINYLGV